VFLEQNEASPPGDTESGYAAFAWRGDDGGNGVMIVIGSQLFFFTVLRLKPF